MVAAKWSREDEFMRLFKAQIKRMTRDGLDTLVYIAIKDMNECYKAVPALALHFMKKESKEGPTRLNIIRVVDAIIGKSRLKSKSKDKFVPRMEASKTCQALFTYMKDCDIEHKTKASKILQVWRKHSVLSPPCQAATEDALGTDLLPTSGDSAAIKAQGVSSNVMSASDNDDLVADANTRAVAAAAAAAAAAHAPVAPPEAAQRKHAEPAFNDSSDSGHKATGVNYLPPSAAAHSASATATVVSSAEANVFPQAKIHKEPAQDSQAARTSSEEMRRSLAQLSQGGPADALTQDTKKAAAPLAPSGKDAAPPLPPDDVAPFEAGVDAVVLSSGATLTNPQIAVGKPPRRSKFDKPATGTSPSSPPADSSSAWTPPMPGTEAPAHSPSAAPPGLPALAAASNVYELPKAPAKPQGPSSSAALMAGRSSSVEPHSFPMRPPGEAPALMMSVPTTHSAHTSVPNTPPEARPSFQNERMPPPSSLAPAPANTAVEPGITHASIEVLPPPSFGEVWNPAPNAVKPATPSKPPVTPVSAPAVPVAVSPTLRPPDSGSLPHVSQQHQPAPSTHPSVAPGGYNMAMAAAHAPQPSPWAQGPSPPGVGAQAYAQPRVPLHQGMHASPRMSMPPQFLPNAPPGFIRSPAGLPPVGHPHSGHSAAGHLPAPAHSSVPRVPPLMNSNAPRAPFPGGPMQSRPVHVPYNPFAASGTAPVPLQRPQGGATWPLPPPSAGPASGPASNYPRGPVQRPVSMPVPASQAMAGNRAPQLPGPPSRPASAAAGVNPPAPSDQHQQQPPGPPARMSAAADDAGSDSPPGLPPPPPPPAGGDSCSKSTGQENSSNGHGSHLNGTAGKAGSIDAAVAGGAEGGEAAAVVPQKRRRSRWDDEAPVND